MDEVTVKLGLDSSSLKLGLQAAGHDVEAFAHQTKERFGDALKELGGSILAPLAGGAASVAAFEGLVNMSKEMLRAADATGFTVEQYQRFIEATREVGMTSENAERTLEHLADLIGQAGQGSSEAQGKFDKWGVTIRAANGQLLETSAVLDAVSNRMLALEDPTVKTAMAMDLLGKNGARAVALLKDGADALHAKGAGAAILTKEDLEAIVSGGEFIERMTQKVKVLGAEAILGLRNMLDPEALATEMDAATKVVDERIAKMKHESAQRIISGEADKTPYERYKEHQSKDRAEIQSRIDAQREADSRIGENEHVRKAIDLYQEVVKLKKEIAELDQSSNEALEKKGRLEHAQQMLDIENVHVQELHDKQKGVTKGDFSPAPPRTPTEDEILYSKGYSPRTLLPPPVIGTHPYGEGGAHDQMAQHLKAIHEHLKDGTIKVNPQIDE